MIFLALDIDGVLHPFFPRADLPDSENQMFSYLPRFERVLRDYPNVHVVIASDWQKHHTLEELRAFFSVDLRERIVGVSGRHPGDIEPGNRQRDVERYFAERGLHDAVWCALDDDEQNYLPGAALVLCADGFCDHEEALLRAVLDVQEKDEIEIQELASAGKLRAPINQNIALPPDEVDEEELHEASPDVNPDWPK